MALPVVATAGRSLGAMLPDFSFFTVNPFVELDGLLECRWVGELVGCFGLLRSRVEAALDAPE